MFTFSGGYLPETDWVNDDSPDNRTRQEYPYSYGLSYKWRDFNKYNTPSGLSCEWSDRLSQQEYKKYNLAKSLAKIGWIEDANREQVERFVAHFYDGAYTCVGFATCANQSSGYGIGLFYLKSTYVPPESLDS
jgi:hypothetical protein